MVKFRPIKKSFQINGLYSAFGFQWDESFVFSGESHDFWEAVFVYSGEVEVTEDENVYILGEGDLIFHAPMEFHRIKSAQGSCPKGFIFTFSALGEFPKRLSEGIFSLDPAARKEYEDICQLVQSFSSDPENASTGQELAASLEAFLLRLGHRSVSPVRSMSGSAMEYRRIVSFMSERVMENLTLSDVARENNVSVSYIQLLFSNYAGVSPKAYFNKLRLRRAAELLGEGFSVTEVADQMSFSSPNYFSAFYKKHTGYSPSEQQR